MTHDHAQEQATASFPLRGALWLAAAAAGLSAPSFIGVGPPWLDWLIKGTGGSGQAWRLFGVVALCISMIELLAWAAHRFNSPIVGHVGTWLHRCLIGVMILGGVAFVALFGSLLVDLLTPALEVVLPKVVAVHLIGLSHGPWAWTAVGVIAAVVVATATVAHFRIRGRDPDSGVIETIGAAALYSLEPFFLYTMIGLTSFVSFAFLVLFVTQWFPYLLGSASSWIDSNSQFLLSLVVGLSLLAPIILHGWHLHRNKDGHNKPRFASSCWVVFWVVSGFGLMMLTGTMLIAVLRSV
jgi:hypothetical protein